MPFETAVRLRFDRFHGFVEQYSANLSLGGMFIKSDELPPLGSEVAVEFRLEDGFELIRGRGRVAWVHEPAEGGDAAGFGLRFLELTPGSRELIFRLVERRVREGDRVFDLEEAAPQTAASRLLHDEEHLGAPPWDLPAPRGGEEAARAEGGPIGGEATLYGRAAREAAEEEPGAGAHLTAVREPQPAGDPEASFAGLVEVADEEETAEPDGAAEGLAASAGGGAGRAAFAGEDEAEAPSRGDRAERLDEEGASAAGEDEAERPSIEDGTERLDEEDGGAGGAAGGAAGAVVAAPAEPGDGAAAASGREAASGSAVWGQGGQERTPWAGGGDALAGDLAAPAATSALRAASAEYGGAEPAVEEGTAAGGGDRRFEPAESTAHDFAGAGHAGGTARRGRLVAVVAAAVAVLAVGGFLLFRAWASSPVAADSAATEAPAAAASAPAGDDSAAPSGAAAEAVPGAAAGPGTSDQQPPGTSPPRSAEAFGDEATAADAPPPADGPRTVESIDWRRRDGGLDFQIAGGRPIAAGQVDHFRVGGQRPRLVVRIAGIERPFARGEIAVGGPLVERVRTGFHPAAGGGSLHVVFDLASAGAEAAVDPAGGGVRVRIEAP